MMFSCCVGAGSGKLVHMPTVVE